MKKLKRSWAIVLSLLLVGLLANLWAAGTESKSAEIVAKVEKGDIKAVKAMLDEGRLQVNGHFGRWRSTPLIRAALSNQVRMVEFLLEEGASVNVQDRKGISTYMWVKGPSYLGDAKYKQGQINFLRKRKMSQKEIDEWSKEYDRRYSPDVVAKRTKIKALIEKAYKDEMEQVGASPLWEAIKSDNLARVKTIFAGGTIKNIDMQNAKGETPLTVAVRNGHFEITKFLIQKGAKLGAAGKGSKSAYTYAKEMFDLFSKARKERDIKAFKRYISRD
jgi:ankyrin repeat protein